MLLLMIGSLGLILVYLHLINRYKDYFLYIMLAGAVSWFIGNAIVLIKDFYPEAVPWWISFILLTVFGERLELNKFLPRSRIKSVLMVAALVTFVMGIMMPYHGYGRLITGIGLVLIGLWLLKFDIASKSIKVAGVHRYTGSLLIFGYVWLLVCGVLVIFEYGDIFHYDIMLHTFFYWIYLFHDICPCTHNISRSCWNKSTTISCFTFYLGHIATS